MPAEAAEAAADGAPLSIPDEGTLITGGRGSHAAEWENEPSVEVVEPDRSHAAGGVDALPESMLSITACPCAWCLS